MIQPRNPRTLFVASLSLAAALALTVPSEDVTPRMVGNQLLVAAPKTHFIVGRALERLRNTASAVPFDLRLTVANGKGNPALEQALGRFLISYDIWEERFMVMKVNENRHSAAGLSASAAEAWCLENISLSTANIPADQRLWLRLEIRSDDRSVRTPSGDSGISIATLIDVFSRPPRSLQDHWILETGPFRLNDLRRQ